jgi:8-oxo-dGTP diphosphatase
MKNHIQVIARAVIVDDGHVLLTCGTNGTDTYTYLPGGHVELGETTSGALMRELYEEIGITDGQIGSFLGVHECRWHNRHGKLEHEINFVFTVNVPGFSRHQPPASQESHIAFIWAPLSELATVNLLPTVMRTHLTHMLSHPQTDPLVG